MIKKLSKETTNDYLTLLQDCGEDQFYLKVMEAGLARIGKVENPEIILLDFSEAFFQAFKNDQVEAYFTIGKILRRASHTIYRTSLKRDKNKKPNFKRFLNIA